MGEKGAQVCTLSFNLPMNYILASGNLCVAASVSDSVDLVCPSSSLVVIDQAWVDKKICVKSQPVSQNTNVTDAVVNICRNCSSCAVPYKKGTITYVNIEYHCTGEYEIFETHLQFILPRNGEWNELPWVVLQILQFRFICKFEPHEYYIINVKEKYEEKIKR